MARIDLDTAIELLGGILQRIATRLAFRNNLPRREKIENEEQELEEFSTLISLYSEAEPKRKMSLKISSCVSSTLTTQRLLTFMTW